MHHDATADDTTAPDALALIADDDLDVLTRAELMFRSHWARALGLDVTTADLDALATLAA